MRTEIEYIKDERQATSICTIYDRDAEFVGIATCHADDIPYASELTGGHISEARAIIKYMQHQKLIVSNQLKCLRHVYGCIKSSSKHQPKSIESRLIRNQIRVKENELAEINSDIKDVKENLKEYITLKNKQFDRYKALAENN